MYCMNCGQKLPEDVNFCIKCGANQRVEVDKTDIKLNVELIYNQSGVDIYSKDENTIKELYDICSSKIGKQFIKNLSKVNANENLSGFQYTKRFLSFKDDSNEVIIGCVKAYLMHAGWEFKTNTRGFDTSGYKVVFSKYIIEEIEK